MMNNYNIKELYKPFSNGVFRTPIYSLEVFKDLFNVNKSYDELSEHILAFYNDKTFLEIIYLSSYELYDFLESFVEGPENSKKRNLIASIAKYISRASTRATPFGLNAGIGVFEIGNEESKICIKGRNDHLRRVRLDNQFVRELYSFLITKFQRDFEQSVRYYANPTIYLKGEYHFYIERTLDIRNKISYGSAKVQNDEVLEHTLKIAEEGLTKEDINNSILSTFSDVELEQVNNFINELIDSNLIIGEFELLDVSDITFFDKIVDFLTTNNILFEIKESLLKVNDIISQLDNTNIELDCIGKYNSIKEIFLEIGLPKQVVDANIFHVDLKITSQINSYNKKEAINHLEMVDLLLKVSEKREFESIKTFKKKFQERYGDAEVCILEVLNKETGIGYEKRNIDDAYPDTLNDIHIKYNSSTYNLALTAFQTTLVKKISNCLAEGNSKIELQKSDIENIKYDVNKLPNTLNLIFSKISDQETQTNKFLIHPTGNSSAVSMIARFSNNEEIYNMCNDIVNKDKFESGLKDYEFNHISQFRSLNVINRNFKRENEVSIFAAKSQAKTKLSDISVGISQNIIYLINNKTREIINPHISHVYDFQNDISLYTFIGDVQQEYSYSPLMFSWYNITKIFPHRPRLEYKSYILHPESWSLSYSDFKHLEGLNEKDQKFLNEISLICKRLSLKKNILIAEDDLELPINLDQSLSASIFFQTLKKRKKITVLENLQLNSSDLIKGIGNNIYANQIIIPYYLNDSFKREKVNRRIFSEIAHHSTDRSILPFVEDFLYLKIYGGKQLLEELLVDEIHPLITSFITESRITKWFFIRYSDPEFHLRIRIFFKDMNDKLIFSKEILNILTKAKNNGFSYKVSLDTYERELERYTPNIHIAETVFFHDTESIISILNLKRNVSNETFTLLVLWYIDFLITERFKLPIEEKVSFLSSFATSMFNQLDLSKTTKVSIDTKFRHLKPKIIQALHDRILDNIDLDFYKEEFLKQDIGGVYNEIRKDQIGSVLHMALNRIFVSNQNLNELVIYSLLQKYYLFVFKNKTVYI